LRAKEKEKVKKVITFRYLVHTALAALKGLMHFFSVDKGGTDIRIVYNGTKSGLNEATWIPWFAISSSSTLERVVIPGSVQADNDFEDMLLNFVLYEDLQEYTGVGVSGLFTDEQDTEAQWKYVKWDRPAMGLTGLPYTCFQGACRVKRVALGDRGSNGNPFQWDTVVTNLPGTWGYDPSMPKLFKRRADGLLAADLVIYIDDVREVANSHEEAWKASSRVAKTCAWLGLQDAARKRREPSTEPGAWAGTVMWGTEVDVRKMVTHERWDKTKRKLNWIVQTLDGERGGDIAEECPGDHVPHKPLESIRGFLVYVARTYPTMVPYLKGIHLTLDHWREGRGKDGWPLDDDGWRLTNTIDNKVEDPEARQGRLEPPKFVEAAERLKDDVRMLVKLTEDEEPPRVLPVRARESGVGYLFGDASGGGFGTSLWMQGTGMLDLTYGTWKSETSRKSSNFREFANFVRRVEQLVKTGRLKPETELFMFTGNFDGMCVAQGDGKVSVVAWAGPTPEEVGNDGSADHPHGVGSRDSND
jgi:hypothetical protein